RPPSPRTPPAPPGSAGRARLHLGLDLLRLLRDAGAEHARAGLRDHHVVLDADAAEAAPALDGVVVDEVGVALLGLPLVDQGADEVDAGLDGEHVAHREAAGEAEVGETELL